MIATAWRVVGLGFSLVVILTAALLYGVTPQQTNFSGVGVGNDVFISFDLRTDEGRKKTMRFLNEATDLVVRATEKVRSKFDPPRIDPPSRSAE